MGVGGGGRNESVGQIEPAAGSWSGVREASCQELR